MSMDAHQDLSDCLTMDISDISHHIKDVDSLVNGKEEAPSIIEDYESKESATDAGETEDVKYVRFIIQDESNSSENDEVKYVHVLAQQELNSTSENFCPIVAQNGEDVIQYVSADDLNNEMCSENASVVDNIETDPEYIHNIESLNCVEDTKSVVAEQVVANDESGQHVVAEDNSPVPIVTDVKVGVSGTQIIQIDNISYEIAPVSTSADDDEGGQQYEIIRMISESELETEFCTGKQEQSDEVHARSEIIEGNLVEDTTEVSESSVATKPQFMAKGQPEEEWNISDDRIPIDFRKSEFCGKLDCEEECTNKEDPLSENDVLGNDIMDEVESLEMCEDDNAQNAPLDEEGKGGVQEKQQPEVFEVPALDELENRLQEYCQRTTSHFVGLRRSKNFGVPITPDLLIGHPISWIHPSTNTTTSDTKSESPDNSTSKTKHKFDGIPYIVVAYNLLQCQYGVNRSLADRERCEVERAEKGIDVTDNEIKLPSKKCGCPAQINVRYIVKFPDYKIDEDTSWRRRETAAKLSQQLRDGWDNVSMEARFVGQLPDVNEHRYHELLEGVTHNREFDVPELVVKAQELWLDGNSKKEILTLLKSHVVDEMFWNKDPPDPNMKRYYPTLKNIHNYVNRVRYMCKFREEEKERVKEIINDVLATEPATNVSFDISETMLGMNETEDTSSCADQEDNAKEGEEENEKKDLVEDKKEAKKGVENDCDKGQIPEEKKDDSESGSVDDVIIIDDDQPGEQEKESLGEHKELGEKSKADHAVAADTRKSKGTNVETFLFCYQTPHQQRLLKKYSNATYLVNVDMEKPTKAVLTYVAYLLLVQTNVDYQVVGTILVSKHRKEGLQEALNIFREWNVFWTPKYFLVDYCERSYNVVVNAIAAVFPESVYFINTQSCEKQWMTFILQPWNSLKSHVEELVKFLKNMQFSLTEESLSIAALLFEQSQVWQNSDKFRTWFQTKWLPIAKYWVLGYRPEDLLLLHHTKSTIDETVEPYQVALHLSAKYNGFTDLLKSLVNSIPQDGYNGYVKLTNEAHDFYTTFRSNLCQGELLQGVPATLLPYVGNICALSQQHDFTIRQDQVRVFNVEYVAPPEQSVGNSLLSEALGQSAGSPPPPKTVLVQETLYGRIECSSQLDPGEFTVSFGDTTSYPFCTCTHWMLYRLPCVHMFAVFINVPGWRYDMLSPLYRFSDVMHLDLSCVTQSAVLKNVETGTQSDSYKETIGTQTTGSDKPANIFETATYWSTSHLVLKDAKEFLSHIRKNSFLFRNKILYSQMCLQLDKLISKFSVSNRLRKAVTTSSNSPLMKTETSHRRNASITFQSKQRKKNNLTPVSSGTAADTHKPLKVCSSNMPQIASAKNDTAMGSPKLSNSSSMVKTSNAAHSKSALDKIASKCQVPNAVFTLKHSSTTTTNNNTTNTNNTTTTTNRCRSTRSTSNNCTAIFSTRNSTRKNTNSCNNANVNNCSNNNNLSINKKHHNNINNSNNSCKNLNIGKDKSNGIRSQSSQPMPMIDGVVTMDTDIMEDSDTSWPSLPSLPTTCDNVESACTNLISTCMISTQSTIHMTPTKENSNQLTLTCTNEVRRPSSPCSTLPTVKKTDIDITRTIAANITKVYPKRSTMSPISSQKKPGRKRENSENSEEGSSKKPKIAPIVRVTPATKAKIQKLVAAAANVTKGKYTLRRAKDGTTPER